MALLSDRALSIGFNGKLQKFVRRIMTKVRSSQGLVVATVLFDGGLENRRSANKSLSLQRSVKPSRSGL